MRLDPSIQKVLVLGSGPIVIGQAAEFDYAGAQACRVLKEAGVNVVLCNSNPATIMTDKEIADKVWAALQSAPSIASDFTMTEVRAGSREASALVEKHLISPDLARKGGYLVASTDGGAAIMIEEEEDI